jgi:hypothetical protein
MKKINKQESIKIALIISFLATIFLALISSTLFSGNELVKVLHIIFGILFSILAILHIISHSKKKKR